MSRVAGVLVAAAALLGACSGARPSSRAVPRVAPSSMSIAAAPGPPPPKGWKSVDFEQIRFYVPPDWFINPLGDEATPCAVNADKVVWFGQDPGNPSACSEPHASNSLRIQPLANAAMEVQFLFGQEMSINGYEVRRASHMPAVVPVPMTFLVDQENARVKSAETNENVVVTFGADTPTTEAIFHTLGPSGRALALQPGAYAPVPKDWEGVSVGHVSLRVPPRWAIHNVDAEGTLMPPISAFAYGGPPAVYTSYAPPKKTRPQGCGCAGSPPGELLQRTFVVVEREPQWYLAPFGRDESTQLQLPHAAAWIKNNRDGESTDLIDLWLPEADTEVAIGLGNGWETARTILGSIAIR